MRRHKRHARKQRDRARYSVTVYQWSADERAWCPTARYTGYSLASAKRRADSEASELPPIVTTWDLRAYARAGFASVHLDNARTRRAVYSADQRVEYVASIGDRGY